MTDLTWHRRNVVLTERALYLMREDSSLVIESILLTDISSAHTCDEEAHIGKDINDHNCTRIMMLYVHGAGGAHRQAQVLSAVRGMAACRQECKNLPAVCLTPGMPAGMPVQGQHEGSGLGAPNRKPSPQLLTPKLNRIQTAHIAALHFRQQPQHGQLGQERV